MEKVSYDVVVKKEMSMTKDQLSKIRETIKKFEGDNWKGRYRFKTRVEAERKCHWMSTTMKIRFEVVESYPVGIQIF